MKRTPGSASFGTFEFDFQTHELRKRGLKVHLAEQPSRILAFLLDKPGTLVTREELRERLWPNDTFVDFDHSLNTAIMRLRRALNDSHENPQFIETLSRRGYRFIAPVKKSADADASDQVSYRDTDSHQRTMGEGNGVRKGRPAWRLASILPKRGRWIALTLGVASAVILAAVWVHFLGRAVHGARNPSATKSLAQPLRSLAVLPLENVSGDKTQQYLADGITQQLVTDLAKIRALTVISGPANANHDPIQQLARRLHADAVVEGTLLRSGKKVRITAELVQGSTGRYLWAGSYQARLGDILQVENTVAQTIADQTQIEITPQERKRLTKASAVNPEAYADYLKGLYDWNQRSQGGLARATTYFHQAIRLDPQYALAYAGLADCYAVLGSTVAGAIPPQQAAAKAEAAAHKALQLNHHLAQAQTVLATIQFNYDWNWPAAEAGFERAIELNPSYATAYDRYSLFLMAMGRVPESLAEMQQARELDPLSRSVNVALGWRLYLARRYDQAIQQLQTTTEMFPDFALAHLLLGEAHEQKGQYRMAIAEIEKATALSHGRPLMESELGRAYAGAGQRARAEGMLDKLQAQAGKEYVSAFQLAIIYAALGEKDEAVRNLEKAYQERANGLVFIKMDPEFDSLRSNPAFERILQQLHLPA